jgi:hypothetical protein
MGRDLEVGKRTFYINGIVPGPKPSAIDIDIAFRPHGPVGRLLPRRRARAIASVRPSAPAVSGEKNETRECDLNLNSGRLVRAGA